MKGTWKWYITGSDDGKCNLNQDGVIRHTNCYTNVVKTGTSADLQHWAPDYPSSGSSDTSCASMWVDKDGEYTVIELLMGLKYLISTIWNILQTIQVDSGTTSVAQKTSAPSVKNR